MIVLDNDVLTKWLGPNPDPAVVTRLKQYSGEEQTIPAPVAFESYKGCSSRSQMTQVKTALSKNLDRVLDFTDDVALEAAYLDHRLQSQSTSLDPVDLLNLATAYAEGCTFVTHNRNDFDKGPIHSLADADVVQTT